MTSQKTTLADPADNLTKCARQRLFETLHSQTRARVFRLACRLLSSRTDAEDATQEVYLRAWVHFDHFDQIRSFDAWVFRILTNLVRDRYRSRAVSTCSSEGMEETILPEHLQPSYLDDPLKSVLLAEKQNTVLEAIAKLPLHYQAIFTMLYEEDRSRQEVASALKCSAGAVRTRLHRARKQLSLALARYG